jgi:uncharacterized protein YjbI with pentapeptide repeats
MAGETRRKEEFFVEEDQNTGWPLTRNQVLATIVIVALAIVTAIVGGYALGWAWTGFAKQTLWDWLDLLIIPIVLGLGGYLFTMSENRRTLRIAADTEEARRKREREAQAAQRERELEVEDQRAQDETLQAYIDQIGQLLLDKDRPLLKSATADEVRTETNGDEVRTLARARTLTVLPRLNGERKRSVLQFLYESHLVIKGHVVVTLRGADLREAELSAATLSAAHLSGADLSKASLVAADLKEAQLRDANLSDASLSSANLDRAHMGGADLRRAYLHAANFLKANLSGADLRDADLRDSDLKGANLRGADLREVDLRRATR